MRRAEEGVMVIELVKRLLALARGEEGQDLLEYALLMALISIFAMGAVATLGNTINTIFWQSIASNF
jgi:Flp pilus assembly pilin Flp